MRVCAPDSGVPVVKTAAKHKHKQIMLMKIFLGRSCQKHQGVAYPVSGRVLVELAWLCAGPSAGSVRL